MQVSNVSNISFKGYQEINQSEHPDKLVTDVLEESRQYLREIGNAMPEGRDLRIEITQNSYDTFISAFNYNKRRGTKKLLAQETEHTLLGKTLYFVQKVLAGLKRSNGELEYKKILDKFAMSLYKIKL